MDFALIIYTYRNLAFKKRFMIVFTLAILPAAYLYYDQGEQISLDLETQRIAEQDVRAKFQQMQKSKDELPALQERHNQTENQLARAKKFLPDKVEIEEVLALAAGFENELGVKIQKFGPSEAAFDGEAATGGGNYREIPITIQVRAEFHKLMTFFDQLVHLEKVTHLRNMNLQADNLNFNTSGITVARAELILFESTGGE